MKNNFDEIKKLFTEYLNELIKSKVISVNDMYAVDGVAAMFANRLSTFEDERIKKDNMGQAITILNTYFPDKMNEIIKLISVSQDK